MVNTISVELSYNDLLWIKTVVDKVIDSGMYQPQHIDLLAKITWALERLNVK
ncbi:MAG: hypothetical protein WAM14_08305 [Candidatus Nitrosopolaris sp.]